jgi:hypothetical protein
MAVAPASAGPDLACAGLGCGIGAGLPGARERPRKGWRPDRRELAPGRGLYLRLQVEGAGFTLGIFIDLTDKLSFRRQSRTAPFSLFASGSPDPMQRFGYFGFTGGEYMQHSVASCFLHLNSLSLAGTDQGEHHTAFALPAGGAGQHMAR